MTRPSPVPLCFLVVDSSICEKGLNSLSLSQFCMPQPSSSTRKLMVCNSFPSGMALAITTIDLFENLIAFEIRLDSICMICVSSACTKFGTLFSMITFSDLFSTVALGLNNSIILFSVLWRSNSDLCCSIFPASILEKSSMLLIILRSNTPEDLIVVRYLRFLLVVFIFE